MKLSVDKSSVEVERSSHFHRRSSPSFSVPRRSGSAPLQQQFLPGASGATPLAQGADRFLTGAIATKDTNE